MITVQLSFTLVVPTNCEPVVITLIECIANILTSSNLTASITRIIKLVSNLQASSSLSASALVSKLAQSNLNTESSLAANIQLAKLPSSSLNAGGTLVGDAFITRLFEASLNGNGSIFANPLITKFAVSSLNANASLNASALVSKLPASSLTGAGTLAADLTVGPDFDADAQAFFDRVTTAGGTLTTTEKTAVDTLVIALKADGIWTKMKAIYPMVGASAAACAQNLKSSSFTGTFSSGWTFASTGATPNGTSAYFDTTLIPSIILPFPSLHFSKYNRNNDLIGNKTDGVFQSNISSFVQINYSAGFAIAGSVNAAVTYSPSSTTGFFIITRTATNSLILFRNNINIGSTSSLQPVEFPNLEIHIGRRNPGAFYNSYECALSSIGEGLNNTESSNFYTHVQAFQTTLSRQV
jgi:hypothetical protein